MPSIWCRGVWGAQAVVMKASPKFAFVLEMYVSGVSCHWVLKGVAPEIFRRRG